VIGVNSSVKIHRRNTEDDDWREEAESLLLKVKSWRDTRDTPGRKNHQEEAKLQHLHTPNLYIASPLHVKQRNQEGSRTARRQLLTSLADPQVNK
jgi:hypothetical protein